MQLMGVRDGLVTPKSGEVAICATQVTRGVVFGAFWDGRCNFALPSSEIFLIHLNLVANMEVIVTG